MLEEDIRIYREHILPNLSGHSNWRAYFRVHSLYNAEQAYSLRNAADPRYLSVMTTSILQWPLGDLNRYKVWLHMVLSRLGVIPTKGLK